MEALFQNRIIKHEMLVVLVLAWTELVFLIVAHIVPYFGSVLKNSVDNIPTLFLILMNSASTELTSFLLLTLPVTVFVFPTPY